MSLSPTNPYLNVFFEQTGNVTQARQYFPGSVETVNITTANHVFTVSSLAATEVRPRDLINITVTNQQNTTITINKNYHLVGDTVTFAWTPTDVTGGTTITIVDDAASPNTLATITSTSEGTRSRSSRSFTLGTTGLWISTASVPTSGATFPASPAEGDILYYHSSAWSSLAVGTANQILNSNGTDPAWTSTSKPPSGIQPGAAGATLTKLLVGTKTWDPGSITAPNVQTTTVTVTGAVAGDYVVVTLTTLTAALVLTGYVSSADTVTVVLGAFTGTVDAASGTLNALVIKAA